MSHVLLKLRELQARFPRSAARIYADAARGTFVPPIKLGGGHASAWLLEEVDIVVQARAAGLNEARIKAVVGDLLAARVHADAPERRQAVLRKHLPGGVR